MQTRGGAAVADVVAGMSAVSILPAPHVDGKKGDQSRMRIVRIDQSIPRGARQSLTLTCKMHREPPAAAAVKWVAIVIRRVGERTTVEVQLTMEHESFAEPKRPAGTRATEHIKIGWAAVDGGVRVAHWPGGEVVVPTSILAQHDHAASITSAADAHFVTAKKLLRRVMRGGPHRLTAWHRMLSDRARQTMREACEGYAHFVLGEEYAGKLWGAWVISRKSRGEDLYAMPRMIRPWLVQRGVGSTTEALAFWCLAWAKKDRHLSQYAIDSERRFGHRRDAFMRSEAIRIGTEFAAVTVDDYSIAKLKELDPLTMPGDGVRDMAQAQLHSAAPGRFRELLLDVMGPRCTPCERSGDAQTAGVARGPKKQARKRGAAPVAMLAKDVAEGGARNADASAAE